MNIPHSYSFETNSTVPIAGIWYWYDGEKMRIIKIQPLPVPPEYVVLGNISDGIAKVEYTDENNNTKT